MQCCADMTYITKSVQQRGGVLSPLLYSFYVNEELEESAGELEWVTPIYTGAPMYEVVSFPDPPEMRKEGLVFCVIFLDAWGVVALGF